MDNFVVSARKYRPIKFNDVVGQSHITITLKNAIKTNQLAHAFLFCGPRGVGKTTNARILAKVINCENLSADIEPCNECNSCKSFSSNSSFNIFELDAASNNGVEDIRELVQQVRIPPQGTKYKVYIIDEVHMLSSSAFNAFLKTLEEPPPYAIFILATTEKQKIIPTILSRCQVFDFSRIKLEDMVAHLKTIAADRNVQASDESLHLIAQKADGGLRDALSLFDKMASFCNANINLNDVLEQLNILDYEFSFAITDAFLTENRADVLNSFHQILMKGFEGDNILLAIADHFRNLLMCKDAATTKLLEVTDALRIRYAQQAKATPTSFLLSALNILNEADIQFKSSKNKRLHIEICLLKLCYLNRVLLQPVAPQPIETELKKKIEHSSNLDIVAESNIATNYVATSHESTNKPIDKVEQKTIQPETTITSLPKTALKATGSGTSDVNSVSLKGLDLSALKNQVSPQKIEVKEPKEIIKQEVALPDTSFSIARKPYTPMEKFNAMIEKNPVLKDLASELGLEIDF